MQEMRLNKYLSSVGVCSRREADRLVSEGRVTVDGAVAAMGMKVTGQQDIRVNGKPIKKQDSFELIAFYKPKGIVCTTAGFDKNNVIDYLHYPVRIYPIGRLDKDSEGLLLLTNQGNLVNGILRSRNNHEKEYVVTVHRPITGEFVKQMQNGVPILDTVTKPCKVTKRNDRTFTIVITQGLNRQIRRMCEYFGYRVVSLKRVRIMNIRLGNLKPGEYRHIEGEERDQLLKMIGVGKHE
ncbi:MAG: pseudouridine synthase [Lachnospiraceae bacterium]